MALGAAAARCPLPTSVKAEVGRYTSDIEASVYFCVLEALQNAAKHAPRATVAIRLWEEGGSLWFEVADDGPGFEGAAKTDGQGFVNMSDRLGALGGRVMWTSSPGAGVRVAGTVPLAPSADLASVDLQFAKPAGRS
ncbi:hypothetical protein BH18ACT1_BH18ACT1_02630 [soil metagenome]